MMIEFSTREYQFSHGHMPRGRGSWAFFFNNEQAIEQAFWTPGSTTFGEAKKMARDEARRRFGKSPVVVHVGS